ncbi:MAG: hypothetical protein ACJAT2_000697 [Bacteriovoracaceae bacterium]|jgi:hypothetical protein
MRLIVLLSLFLSLFSLAQAQEKMLRIKKKKNKALILLNPKLDIIPLEKLRFKVHRVKREEIQRRLRSGGDDVGNGGDEIRRQILNNLEEIKKEAGPGYQLPDLSTRGLALVEGLEFNGVSYPAIKTDDGILIDRLIYKKLSQSKKDLRILLLDLLFIKADQPDLALSIYSSLSPKMGLTPYCHETFPLHKLLKNPSSESFKGTDSMELLSKQALRICTEKGLNECRIIETGKSGFGSWAKNFATYQGYKYETMALSSSDKKRLSCELAKKCEQVYELAPLRQIKPSAFKEIDQKIEKLCF